MSNKLLPQSRLIIRTDLDISILDESIPREIVRIGANLSIESIPTCEEFSHFFITQILFFISVPIIMNSHQPRSLAFSTREIGRASSTSSVFTGTIWISSLNIYVLVIFSPELTTIESVNVVLPLAVSIIV